MHATARRLLNPSILVLASVMSVAVSADTWQNETGTAPECDWCVLQFPATTSIVVVSEPIYGRIYEAGITEALGASPGIIAQVGIGPFASDARTTPGWTWSAAAFNVQTGNDDEYVGTVKGYSLGQHSYTFRFSLDGGSSWTLADLNGAGANVGLVFEPGQLGTASVTAAVPEPSALAMMAVGLALVGGLARRRRSHRE